MPEREHLRVHRIAHEVHPRTADGGVVPDLLARAAIGDHLVESGSVPEIRMVEDHRHRLEVPPTRGRPEARREVSQLAGATSDRSLSGKSATRVNAQGRNP